MRLLVFGGWFGSKNLGDDAILIGLREIMARTMPDAQITAISMDPDHTRRVCGVDAIALQSPRSLLGDGEKYLSAFRGADAVIVTGGTPIYDYGHLSRIIHVGLPAVQGKPIVLFGVGAKPMRSPQGREITKLLLRRATAISVRDSYSKRVLSQLTAQPIMVTGESGLYISPKNVATRLRKPAVVICPRILSRDYRVHYHTQLTAREIHVVRQMVANATDSLKEQGFNIYFLPFHTVGPDDDLLEAARIMGLMNSKDATLLDRPPTPGQALSLLSSADLVIGLRLHSLVLAAAAGTPVASVNYDPKIGGFMEMAGAEKYLRGLDDGEASLLSAAQAALDDGLTFRSLLIDAVERMRGRILVEATRVKGILQVT